MGPRFVEGAGGLPIATWELGGRGPPLLVAHATGFHTLCMRSLAEGLAACFRVVGFDCRGHGHSGTPPLTPDEEGRVPSMAWSTFADDALAVIDELGLDGCSAFGHSCGGAVVLLAEQRRPGTFAGIFAYEAVVAPPELWAGARERGIDPAAGARRRRAGFASRAEARAHYAEKPPLSSLRPDILADYVEHGFADQPDGSVRLRCSPEAEAATFSMARHSDAWDHLAEVACPTTFACGGDDSPFGRGLTAELARRVQHGRPEEHAALGHLGPMQHPDEVAAAVRSALGPA